MKIKKLMAMLLAVSMIGSLAACGTSGSTQTEESEEAEKIITYAEPNWQTTNFCNQIMKVILEEGYGYTAEAVEATNVALVEDLTNNGIDIHTFIAEISFETYEELRDNGELVECGTMFYENPPQGLYVPAYVINGDAKRGIEAVAPDLKTIDDLAKYPELFVDPEDPTKGVIYNAPADYLAANVLNHKLETYGLTEYYNIMTPGSQSAEDATLAAAYEKGEPWVGYAFVPSYMCSQFELIKLEDRCDFDASLYDEEHGYACDFIADTYKICVSNEFAEEAPEITEFLSKFYIECQDISNGVGYMTDNDDPEGDDAALEWMKNNSSIWEEWIPDDVAEKVHAYVDAM